jgi:UTP--glucose-1-phosphate uridylyltransferase
MDKKVRKAIIPVAGMGTRLLPATKVQPKEMMTLVDKPVAHYLVEEAVEAGIEEILFIINSNKHVVGDYFSRDADLERSLAERGKKELLKEIEDIHKQAKFTFIYQDEPLGSGDAIFRGRSFAGGDPFAVFYADDVMEAPEGHPAIGQLIKSYEEYGMAVAGLSNVPRETVARFGIIKGEKLKERTWRIDELVEKPSIEEASTTLASVGRFILTPDIFPLIEQSEELKGEIYLATALDALARQGKLYGYEIEAKWHDCGTKIGFWKSNFELGLKHPEIGEEARAYAASFRE